MNKILDFLKRAASFPDEQDSLYFEKGSNGTEKYYPWGLGYGESYYISSSQKNTLKLVWGGGILFFLLFIVLEDIHSIAPRYVAFPLITNVLVISYGWFLFLFIKKLTPYREESNETTVTSSANIIKTCAAIMIFEALFIVIGLFYHPDHVFLWALLGFMILFYPTLAFLIIKNKGYVFSKP
ncbi:MAG: hypothetical protein OEY94_04575 [Alphaproteobacteria bacterium]|nr:hypothetical protein [Alphaproteobacteria bacterium]